MLKEFYRTGLNNSKNIDFQLWQQHNHPIELNSNYLIDQKMDYIHWNPVKHGLTDDPLEYEFSSARDYFNDEDGLIEIVDIS
jgi:hypothetical protein